MIDGVKASLNALNDNSSDKEVPLEEKDMPINYVGIALLAFLVPVFLLYVDIVNSLAVACLLYTSPSPRD